MRLLQIGGRSAGAMTISSLALATALVFSVPASASTSKDTASVEEISVTEVKEQDVYLLQFGSEFADGTRVLSHSQEAITGRTRLGDQSRVTLDFRNGAVTSETADGTVASNFQNTTPAEVHYGYDYSTDRVLSNDGFGKFFNTFLRSKLNNGPALGENGQWQQVVRLSELGILAAIDAKVAINITRNYEIVDGQRIAVIEFDIPAFQYRLLSGERVAQWGRGFSVSDDGFGTIHAIGTQHRASVIETDGTLRPMAMKTTAYGKELDGSWRFDMAKSNLARQALAKVAAGSDATALPVQSKSAAAKPNQKPFDIANGLQLLAFALGENSANDVHASLAAYTSTTRGVDAYTPDGATSAENQLNADSFTNGTGLAFGSDSTTDLSADELVHTNQQLGASESDARAEERASQELADQILQSSLFAETSQGDASGAVQEILGNVLTLVEMGVGMPEGERLIRLPGMPDSHPGVSEEEFSAAMDTFSTMFSSTENEPSPTSALPGQILRNAITLIEMGISKPEDEQLIRLPGMPDSHPGVSEDEFSAAMATIRNIQSSRQSALDDDGNGDPGQGNIPSLLSIVEQVVEFQENTKVLGPGVPQAENEVIPELLNIVQQVVEFQENTRVLGPGVSRSDEPVSLGGTSLTNTDDLDELIRQMAQDAGTADDGPPAYTKVPESTPWGLQPTIDPIALRRIETPAQEAARLALEQLQANLLADKAAKLQADADRVRQRNKVTGVYNGEDFFDNNAHDYGLISAQVETSLSQWAEWLATQDVRQLERMALKAGYLNLATALDDAANLMRNANDQGWRKWAMAPPSCNGLAGCGPQYLERWSAKRSRLALGDILFADREFFSTGGLSDVSIAALMLMFSIRDFGLEDGDRVSIAVRQFGQSLFSRSLTLTNAGNSFSIPVRKGVVSVNVTALNTGDIPPNTAALTINGVTGGESDQSYSLDEGGGAGLRVSVGGSN